MAFNFISGNDPPVLLNRARPLLFWSQKKNHSRMARGLRECHLNKSVRSGKEIRIIIEAGPTYKNKHPLQCLINFLFQIFYLNLRTLHIIITD